MSKAIKAMIIIAIIVTGIGIVFNSNGRIVDRWTEDNGTTCIIREVERGVYSVEYNIEETIDDGFLNDGENSYPILEGGGTAKYSITIVVPEGKYDSVKEAAMRRELTRS